MRKIRKQLAILSAKIAELEFLLMQNLVGQEVNFWLKVRSELVAANEARAAIYSQSKKVQYAK